MFRRARPPHQAKSIGGSRLRGPLVAGQHRPAERQMAPAVRSRERVTLVAHLAAEEAHEVPLLHHPGQQAQCADPGSAGRSVFQLDPQGAVQLIPRRGAHTSSLRPPPIHVCVTACLGRHTRATALTGPSLPGHAPLSDPRLARWTPGGRGCPVPDDCLLRCQPVGGPAAGSGPARKRVKQAPSPGRAQQGPTVRPAGFLPRVDADHQLATAPVLRPRDRRVARPKCRRFARRCGVSVRRGPSGPRAQIGRASCRDRVL